MDREREASHAPKYREARLANDTTVPLRDVLRGDSKIVVKKGVCRKVTVAALGGRLYLRDEQDGILLLSNGRFNAPGDLGAAGVSIQVDLQTGQLIFLVQKGRAREIFTVSVDTFNETDRKCFAHRVEEALATQSTARTRVWFALLVAAALATAGATAGTVARGCGGCATLGNQSTLPGANTPSGE